ncbi:MAG: DeoR/GlpR transcriptional regulator [Anaerolineales bacterium]|nr:DeoR/GlpR transcriptional regulator [Anaerolineales bacterium]MCW5855616.1 DeoR/GlpR transcriptional regulator [Anaerolineales bacterium]MCW5877876.1 DeoR/GlpR transcriptional regulator [Anaerolineales bacterium]
MTTTAERRRWISEQVISAGHITIADISTEFGVSEMTARRDLSALDRDGLVRRVHGGAIVSLGRSFEPPFRSRLNNQTEVKRRIGLKAAELILNGDSIALDVGTTTLEIVPGLASKRNLTIVASSLQIANEVVRTLPLENHSRLILTGGIVRPGELSMTGPIPEKSHRELHVDKAFLGMGGISPRDGLTEYNIEDARIKQVLLEQAREKIIVADGSKFGQTTFAHVGPLSKINTIVTDSSAPADILKEIEAAGVTVIIAD